MNIEQYELEILGEFEMSLRVSHILSQYQILFFFPFPHLSVSLQFLLVPLEV